MMKLHPNQVETLQEMQYRHNEEHDYWSKPVGGLLIVVFSVDGYNAGAFVCYAKGSDLYHGVRLLEKATFHLFDEKWFNYSLREWESACLEKTIHQWVTYASLSLAKKDCAAHVSKLVAELRKNSKDGAI